MGAIEKRGKNSWRISAWTKTDHGPQQVRMTLHMDPSLPEAVQRQDAARELAQLELRLSSPARSFTLREWSEEWLTKHQPDNSAVTVSNYRQLLNSRILPVLGDVPLQDLTPARLNDWMLAVRNSPRMTTRKPDDQLKHSRRKSEKLIPPSKQAQPLSAKTLLNYYGCMSSMLQVAVRMGYLDYNPMDRVQRPKQKKKKQIPVNEQKAVQLLRDIMNVDETQRVYRTAVLLALTCSLRLGEVGGLMWSDFDYYAQTLTISRALKYTAEQGSFIDAPKSAAAERVISLPPSMVEYLDNERREDNFAEIIYYTSGIPEDQLQEYSTRWIVHGPLGRQLNKDTPSKWFSRFVREHGYGKFTFHDLRHAHASILVAHNIDIATVAARMGHSDSNVTLATYTHPVAQRDQAAAQVIEDLLAPLLPPPEDIADDPEQDPEDLAL